MMIKYVDPDLEIVSLAEVKKVDIVPIPPDTDGGKKTYMLSFVASDSSFTLIQAHTTSYSLCLEVVNQLYYTGRYDFSADANFTMKNCNLLEEAELVTTDDLLKMFGISGEEDNDDEEG